LWTTKAWVTFALNDSYLPGMRFPQHWQWEFWPFGMSRCVAGLIHPDVSKGTVSTLSLWCICVWHFIYCTASSSELWVNVFSKLSHLLHGLPTILHPPDVYLTTCNRMLPSVWCDYDWPLSSSNLCYSYWKKIFPFIFTINL
jgi:hypothetical protein